MARELHVEQLIMELTKLLEYTPGLSDPYDYTTPEFESYIQRLEELVGEYDLKEVDKLIRDTYKPDELDTNSPLYLQLVTLRTALKIMEGRRNLEQIDVPTHVTVVLPMYKEGARISPRTDENPYGEDALRVKLNALAEMVRRNLNLTAEIIVVDDGCPAEPRSGEVARQIIDDWRSTSDVQLDAEVLLLDEELQKPEVQELLQIQNTKESVKGGAVLAGMHRAVVSRDTARQRLHIVVDWDTDLSMHPWQLPNLVLPIVKGETYMTAGSRREPDSVKLIGAHRGKRGQLFIKVWQALLPTLAANITDTNRGFKALHADAVHPILNKVKQRKFPYQIEMLLVGLKEFGNVQPVGVSYIDSEALSTQSDDNVTQTYLDQVAQILAIAETHGEPMNSQLANIIKELKAAGPMGEAIWLKIEKECQTIEEIITMAQIELEQAA